MKNKPFYLVLASVLMSALLVVVGVLVGSGLTGTGAMKGAGSSIASEAQQVSDTVDTDSVAEAQAGASADSIAIPGFESLTLKAGQLHQSVNLFNPETNVCYFRIILCLPDGVEIYKTGLLKPGQIVEEIELLSVLEAGTYEGASLRYECYSLDTLQPLNGAETNLELEVIP